MKHTITNSLAALLLLATGLTACSKQETEGDRLPHGEHPVKLIAAMQEPHSRATADNTWEGTELVAVEINGEVKKHMADANGTLKLQVGLPWYWQSTTETKSATAWYSHTYQATRPASFAVQADQHAEGYQRSDIIYARQEITIANQILIFKHLPAKMVINLKAGDGMAADEVTNATVTIVNQATTSEGIAEDGSVAQVTKGGTPIIPKSITAASGYQMSIQALLVPQQMQGKRFIKITIGADAAKRNFYYTPTGEGDANLTAGKLHRLNLVVKSSGLEFVSSTVEEWDDNTEAGEGEVKPLPPAQVGDFYMNDGTWLSGSTELTDKQKAACIGIVLKVGRDSEGEWIDDCQYRLKDGITPMNIIQGYVLALYDANEGNPCTWGSAGTEVGIQTQVWLGFYGYRDTNTIKAFAQTNSMTLQDAFPSTYYATDGYEATHAAPDNTSGWFLPSAGQCKYWADKKDVLLKSVQKATGKADYYWADYDWYWASSEFYDAPDRRGAWCLFFEFGRAYMTVLGKIADNNVRSVLAF